MTDQPSSARFLGVDLASGPDLAGEHMVVGVGDGRRVVFLPSRRVGKSWARHAAAAGKVHLALGGGAVACGAETLWSSRGRDTALQTSNARDEVTCGNCRQSWQFRR